ncbi:FprA family A-type flavoprotein [candidate division KSB1 bacterium]|nr:FprA family A-type flavoprotein [candidate division KSB1 bacterium]
MKPVQITSDVYWIGALHPDLRNFDILMHTKNGTTYNSYLIKDQSVAIIDTVKEKYTEQYLQRISELVNLSEIAYIIVQHNEMDHSGSLAALLEAAPGAKVVCSKPAVKFVNNIINREVEILTVENGQVLDLGRKKIEFITAPFLHWPDTMMSYLQDDKILFSCDFLAMHFCDSHMFDDLITRDMWPDFKYYFQVIMRPFKKHVRNALKKIDDKSFSVVAPSHGPILRQNINKYIKAYEQWSAPLPENNPKKLMIAYASAHGNTEKMAHEIERGAKSAGLAVQTFDMVETDPEDLLDDIESADAIAVGSPTINNDAVQPIWNLLSRLATIDVKGKIAASFGSMGWSGEAVPFLDQRLSALKFKVPVEGIQAVLVPSAEEIQKCYEFGARLAQEIKKA